jgi:hypothetical protein
MQLRCGTAVCPALPSIGRACDSATATAQEESSDPSKTRGVLGLYRRCGPISSQWSHSVAAARGSSFRVSWSVTAILCRMGPAAPITLPPLRGRTCPLFPTAQPATRSSAGSAGTRAGIRPIHENVFQSNHEHDGPSQQRQFKRQRLGEHPLAFDLDIRLYYTEATSNSFHIRNQLPARFLPLSRLSRRFAHSLDCVSPTRLRENHSSSARGAYQVGAAGTAGDGFGGEKGQGGSTQREETSSGSSVADGTGIIRSSVPFPHDSARIWWTPASLPTEIGR